MGVRRESEGKEPCPEGQHLHLDSCSAERCHASFQTLLPFSTSRVGTLTFPCSPRAKCSSMRLPPLLSQPRGWEWAGRGGGACQSCRVTFLASSSNEKFFVPPSPLFQLNQYQHWQVSVGKTKVETMPTASRTS